MHQECLFRLELLESLCMEVFFFFYSESLKMHKINQNFEKKKNCPNARQSHFLFLGKQEELFSFFSPFVAWFL
jgi:hypothetical protein